MCTHRLRIRAGARGALVCVRYRFGVIPWRAALRCTHRACGILALPWLRFLLAGLPRFVGDAYYACATARHAAHTWCHAVVLRAPSLRRNTHTHYLCGFSVRSAAGGFRALRATCVGDGAIVCVCFPQNLTLFGAPSGITVVFWLSLSFLPCGVRAPHASACCLYLVEGRRFGCLLLAVPLLRDTSALSSSVTAADLWLISLQSSAWFRRTLRVANAAAAVRQHCVPPRWQANCCPAFAPLRHRRTTTRSLPLLSACQLPITLWKDITTVCSYVAVSNYLCLLLRHGAYRYGCRI